MRKEFETIYLNEYLIIYKYLLSIGCSLDDVEDVLQDSFLKAFLNFDKYKKDSKISVWLCSIAKNTWFNYLKKNKRYSEFNKAVAVSKEKDILLLQSLDSIEEPYNSVFTLRCLYGYEFDEIAKRYNKSESWARVTYHRARLKYQDIFKEVK